MTEYVSPLGVMRRPPKEWPVPATRCPQGGGTRPAVTAVLAPLTLLTRNGKGVARPLLGGACGRLGGSCGRPELPRRDADEALEVTGELALVREAGAQGDLRQG